MTVIEYNALNIIIIYESIPTQMNKNKLTREKVSCILEDKLINVDK